MQAVLSTAPRALLRSALWFSTLLVAACGGGGGGGSGLAGSPPLTSTPTEGYPTSFPDSSLFRNVCADPRSQDQQGTVSDENNWLRSWSNELYLWYDEIVDEDPSAFSTPAYFDLMRTFLLTASGAPKDRFHFTIPTEEWIALSQSGESAGYGAEFTLLSAAPPRDIRVAFVDSGTPAQVGGFVRGSRILAINGEDVATTGNVDLLNAALFPDSAGERYRFTIQNPGESTTRTVDLTSEIITLDPVNVVSLIGTPTGAVGYLSFVDHIAPAEAQLVDAIELFAAGAVTDLVLDVRYNAGGFLDIANELAFMIAGGGAAAGEVFAELEFNDKYPLRNPVTGQLLEPDFFHTTTQGFSLPDGQPLPSLNLERVFVLTSSRTCSASETIINGLAGIDVEVIQIGTTTCGKPYGFYAFDNCGTSYFSIQFRGVNAKGFGDYADGFSPADVASPAGVLLPGCEAADDLDRPLGDPTEGMLDVALAYRETGTCPPRPLSRFTTLGVSKDAAPAGAVTAPPMPGLVRRP